MLTVSTASLATGMVVRPNRWLAAGLRWGGLGVVALIYVMIPRRRRTSVRTHVLMLALLGLLVAFAGCGGSATRQEALTPPGNYTVTVNGVSGATTQTTSVELRVD
jgi:hypothetical protein